MMLGNVSLAKIMSPVAQGRAHKMEGTAYLAKSGAHETTEGVAYAERIVSDTDEGASDMEEDGFEKGKSD